LGKTIDGVVSKEELVGLRCGYLRIEGLSSKRVDHSIVMAGIEKSREKLPSLVTSAKVVYQASKSHPGCLEQVDAGGRKVIGHFENGVFQPLDPELPHARNKANCLIRQDD